MNQGARLAGPWSRHKYATEPAQYAQGAFRVTTPLRTWRLWQAGNSAWVQPVIQAATQAGLQRFRPACAV